MPLPQEAQPHTRPIVSRSANIMLDPLAPSPPPLPLSVPLFLILCPAPLLMRGARRGSPRPRTSEDVEALENGGEGNLEGGAGVGVFGVGTGVGEFVEDAGPDVGNSWERTERKKEVRDLCVSVCFDEAKYKETYPG